MTSNPSAAIPELERKENPTITDVAHAPIVFMDGVSNFGILNGVASLVLVAERNIPKDGAIRQDFVVTAHLRLSLESVPALIQALDAVLLMARPAPTAVQ
jgi:hypothetical protein